MPYINLIEVQRIAARKEEHRVRVSVITLASVTSVILMGLTFLLIQRDATGQEMRTLQANVDALKPLIKEINTSNDERSELEPRLKLLVDAQGLTGRWGRILEHLATSTPRESWLTSVRCTAADAEHPINVALDGVGRDQSDAAEFMMRCQNAGDLENVELRYTQEKMMEKTSAIEFEVGADIIDTAKPQKKEETAGGAA